MTSNTNSTPLLQIAIEALFKRSSPDMLWLVNLASDTMQDPKESGVVRLGAFIVGSFAAGQGLSDVANQANGKPREWISGNAGNLPREDFLTLLQQARSIQLPHTAPRRPKKHHRRGRLNALHMPRLKGQGT